MDTPRSKEVRVSEGERSTSNDLFEIGFASKGGKTKIEVTPGIEAGKGIMPGKAPFARKRGGNETGALLESRPIEQSVPRKGRAAEISQLTKLRSAEIGRRVAEAVLAYRQASERLCFGELGRVVKC